MGNNGLIAIVLIVGGAILYTKGYFCKWFPSTCMGASSVPRLGYNRPTLTNTSGIQTLVHRSARNPGHPGDYEAPKSSVAMSFNTMQGFADTPSWDDEETCPIHYGDVHDEWSDVPLPWAPRGAT